MAAAFWSRCSVVWMILSLAKPSLAAENGPALRQEALPGATYVALGGAWRRGNASELFDAARSRATLPVAIPVGAPRPSAAVPAPTAALRPPAPFSIAIPEVPPPQYRRTFRRLAAHPEVTDRFDALIRRHAARFRIDPRLVKAIIAAESEFVPRAKSPAGALGLMQLMPLTAEEMGIPRSALRDPEANIRAGVSYLAHLFLRAFTRYHLEGVSFLKAPEWLLQRIIAAYNAGPRFLARRRLYRQTRAYVRKVILFYRSSVTDPSSSRAPGLPSRLDKFGSRP